jgi:serine protease Do
VTQRSNSRLGWMLGVAMLLAIVALGVPERLMTHFAYAVQRGRIEADRQQLAGLDEVSNAFRLVARTARPGVVSIQVRAGETTPEDFEELRRQQQDLNEREEQLQELIEDHADSPNDPELLEQLRELLRDRRALERRREQLHERLMEGTGSGIIYDSDGYILTNDHVVGRRSEIRVQLWDDREVEAAVVGTDPESDLALIKINAPDLHPLPLGDSDAMQVGDWVLAVGAPFGLSHTVTHGIVSARGRTNINTGRRSLVYQDFIQTDAAINPGNSGGPLLNVRGEVVGINTAIATNGEAYNAGVAFTIPSNMAAKIAERLKAEGEVARGWLGVQMGELTEADRRLLGITDGRGVLVNGVLEGEPADRAGLQVEDIVLSINDVPVSSSPEMLGVIADVFPGEAARFEVFHYGETRMYTIKLARRLPLQQRAGLEVRTTRRVSPPGFDARTLLPSVAKDSAYGEDARGVLAWELGEHLADAEVSEPVLITQCAGEPVATLGDLLRHLETTAESLQLTLEDGDGQRRTVQLNIR